mmetsp:Transcript_21204/g.53518  ORF Transcript_21204/g.53518 Transcript_21204/m.53518 type:complete len:129 (-) Transcript_21204:37-423(-)|eukprot:CAMPEP_0177663398 /NCGR_PEP_ID=MMETSP0447-20121125/19890_1 /TAXON_ID=0 /ORGANISM="Stygamoeba regulata, Strain BSH-02190019" /LENGTH=128 /DNA_ID=CAMNT_0019169203 /DNA_START=79 /DNA_END=465 /DNA_ORIENTATION=+
MNFVYTIVLSFIGFLLVLLVGWLQRKADASESNAPASLPDTFGRQPITNKAYTIEEVAKHNKRDDIWVIVDDKVFDVTSYVDDHPGGEEAIMVNPGGDNTEAFHGDQHPGTALTLLKQYQIGYVKKTQ